MQVDSEVKRLIESGNWLPVGRELPEVIRVDDGVIFSRCGALGIGRDELDVCVMSA